MVIEFYIDLVTILIWLALNIFSNYDYGYGADLYNRPPQLGSLIFNMSYSFIFYQLFYHAVFSICTKTLVLVFIV